MRMPENLYSKPLAGNLVSPSLLRGKSPDTGQRCPAYSAERRFAQPITAKMSLVTELRACTPRLSMKELRKCSTHVHLQNGAHSQLAQCFTWS